MHQTEADLERLQSLLPKLNQAASTATRQIIQELRNRVRKSQYRRQDLMKLLGRGKSWLDQAYSDGRINLADLLEILFLLDLDPEEFFTEVFGGNPDDELSLVLQPNSVEKPLVQLACEKLDSDRGLRNIEFRKLSEVRNLVWKNPPKALSLACSLVGWMTTTEGAARLLLLASIASRYSNKFDQAEGLLELARPLVTPGELQQLWTHCCASLLHDKGKFIAALNVGRQSLADSIVADDAELVKKALILVARILFSLGRVSDAAAHAKRALSEKEPTAGKYAVAGWQILAISSAQTGEKDQAWAYYDRAFPASNDSYVLVGKHVTRGKILDCLEADPNLADAEFEIAKQHAASFSPFVQFCVGLEHLEFRYKNGGEVTALAAELHNLALPMAGNWLASLALYSLNSSQSAGPAIARIRRCLHRGYIRTMLF